MYFNCTLGVFWREEMDDNANPPQNKSQKKKLAIVDHTKAFVFFGYVLLIGLFLIFVEPARKGWENFQAGNFADDPWDPTLLILPLVLLFWHLLFCVVNNFSHRLKQLESRQRDED
jgi:hypothetical protein